MFDSHSFWFTTAPTKFDKSGTIKAQKVQWSIVIFLLPFYNMDQLFDTDCIFLVSIQLVMIAGCLCCILMIDLGEKETTWFPYLVISSVQPKWIDSATQLTNFNNEEECFLVMFLRLRTEENSIVSVGLIRAAKRIRRPCQAIVWSAILGQSLPPSNLRNSDCWWSREKAEFWTKSSERLNGRGNSGLCNERGPFGLRPRSQCFRHSNLNLRLVSNPSKVHSWLHFWVDNLQTGDE